MGNSSLDIKYGGNIYFNNNTGLGLRLGFILLSVLNPKSSYKNYLILSHQNMAQVSLLSADDLTSFLLMIWLLYIAQPEDRS